MMMPMPLQKPYRSKQDYATPAPFLEAVQHRLGIAAFAFDFAADAHSATAPAWWNVADDALARAPAEWAARCRDGWGWLNPPYTRIEPWAVKCAGTRQHGGRLAFLVPAAVGANWFCNHVDGQARVLLLNGRLAFLPDQPRKNYPKDCVLALFAPEVAPGYEVWTWKAPRVEQVA